MTNHSKALFRLPSRITTRSRAAQRTGSLALTARRAAVPSVSLCAIMRNEENVLHRFFIFALSLCDEIIIADTGSTDRSLKIASKFPCRILHYPWQDDFSGPRNASIEQATSDWVLILDPDEYIDPLDHENFREHLRNYTVPAYVMPTRNYTKERNMIRFIPNDKRYPLTSKFPGYMQSIKTRLFQRKFKFRFESCFHELIDHSIIRAGFRPMLSGLPVQHYCDEKPNRTHDERSKLYLRLGAKKCRLEPNNPQAWSEYGTALAIAGNYIAAYACYCRAASMRPQDETFYISSHVTALRLGLRSHAIFWLEKAMCARHPNLTHAHFLYKGSLPP